MKIKGMLFNVIIVALCAALVLSAGAFIVRYRDAYYGVFYEETSMLYALERGEYYWLLDMAHSNDALGVDLSETQKECLAVAYYYEAAAYYRAYLAAGEQEAAQAKLGQMEERLALMGALSFAAEGINEQLELSLPVE